MKRKKTSNVAGLVLEKSKKYAKSSSPVLSEESEEDEAGLQKTKEKDKERKREKMRLKRQLKKEARAKSVKKDDSEAKRLAINYLRLWNSSRELWSFKKKQQIWLLKNVFSTDNISDDDFAILLNYLIDLKGEARNRLTQTCEKVIEDQEKEAEDTNDDDMTVFERARSILQILV